MNINAYKDGYMQKRAAMPGWAKLKAARVGIKGFLKVLLGKNVDDAAGAYSSYISKIPKTDLDLIGGKTVSRAGDRLLRGHETIGKLSDKANTVSTKAERLRALKASLTESANKQKKTLERRADPRYAEEYVRNPKGRNPEEAPILKNLARAQASQIDSNLADNLGRITGELSPLEAALERYVRRQAKAEGALKNRSAAFMGEKAKRSKAEADFAKYRTGASDLNKKLKAEKARTRKTRFGTAAGVAGAAGLVGQTAAAKKGYDYLTRDEE